MLETILKIIWHVIKIIDIDTGGKNILISLYMICVRNLLNTKYESYQSMINKQNYKLFTT